MSWVLGASPEVEERSRWKAIVATILVFTILMLVTVSSRLWVRRSTIHKEDWITLVTTLFSVIYGATVIIQTRYGLGLPVTLQPRQHARAHAITNYAAKPFYLWGLAGFKLALCISYLRMTKGSTDRRYRIFIIGIAVFCVAVNTIYVFLCMFNCNPLAKMFDTSIPGSCLSFSPINYAISITAIICDVIVFLLPIPLIQRLHLDRAVKLGLTIIFALGLLTTVLSIMRATQIHRIEYGDGDTSYFVIRSGLELNIGIITSCLPVLRPLLRHVPQKIISLLPCSAGHETTHASAVELPGDYPVTQTIGGSFSHHMSSQSGKSWKSLPTPFRTKHWHKFDKGVERMTTTMRGSDESLVSSEQSFGNASPQIDVLKRTSRPLSMTRPLTSMTQHSETETVITGGGRQRWESDNGTGRWEGFGGVIKTVEIDVSSVHATTPTTPTDGIVEFGRGLTRRDEWDFPTPPRTARTYSSSRSRAPSKNEKDAV
ncbi:hypothetical protein AC579_6845 [Pseudocercospora musae]|uniref:Rhodopsin domain-containing protein n=1 Tax=Pseudocercospora musae TaxID=113226 RepID=A0A139I7M9_9PEZI|nr:hypothetical protein AC579_6845 [Pseudocercospora musae]